MPLDDALVLVERDFGEFCSRGRDFGPTRISPYRRSPPPRQFSPARSVGERPSFYDRGEPVRRDLHEQGPPPQRRPANEPSLNEMLSRAKEENMSPDQLSSLINALQEKQQRLQGPGAPAGQSREPGKACLVYSFAWCFPHVVFSCG